MIINRKGQVPILMLFLVAIILVIVALFSFFGFSTDFGDNSLFDSRAISGVEFGYDYAVSSAKLIAGETITKFNGDRVEFMRIANGKDLGIPEAGNFFKKIREGDFIFGPVAEGYKLEIKELFTQSGYGNSEIRRNYNLCMIFEANGEYLKEC